VSTLLEQRQRQLKEQETESGIKQLDTELTDRLDKWQQHLNDIEKVEADRVASKEQ